MAEFGTAIKEGGRATRPSDLTSSSKQMALAGLLVRRYRWGLSVRDFIVFWFSLATVLVVFFLESYPFLAITSSVPSDTLVVEGWMNEYAMKQAAAEYARGHYPHLLTTGGPTLGKGGGYINDFNTSASVGTDLLEKTGIPREAIQMVPSHVNSGCLSLMADFSFDIGAAERKGDLSRIRRRGSVALRDYVSRFRICSQTLRSG